MSLNGIGPTLICICQAGQAMCGSTNYMLMSALRRPPACSLSWSSCTWAINFSKLLQSVRVRASLMSQPLTRRVTGVPTKRMPASSAARRTQRKRYMEQQERVGRKIAGQKRPGQSESNL
eukprot:364684-Chlamydomonas_euryale.AAC.3